MLQCDGCRANDDGSNRYDRGMSKREHKSDGHWTLSLMHQLPCDIVDRGDMIRIHRVTKSKALGKKCGAQEHRKTVKSEERPAPCRQVENQQYGVYGDDLRSCAARLIVQQSPQ